METHFLDHGPSRGQHIFDFVDTSYSDLPVWRMVIAKYSLVGLEVGFRGLGFAAMCALPAMAYLRVTANPVSVALVAWSVSEWIFLLWSVKWIKELENRRPMPFLDPGRRMALAEKVAVHISVEKVLPLWSKSPHVQAKEWLAWAFFDKEKLRPAEERQISILYKKVHRSEESQSICMYRPTLDPLVYKAKPLIFYVLLRAHRHAAECSLKRLGLKKRNGGCINYWKYHSAQGSTSPPIIFIHGVGFGPGTYFNQIQKIIEHHPDRDIYILELPCIIVGSFADIPTMDEILVSFDAFFSENNLASCSFIGHSYGTIVCTWLSYNRPKYIDSLTLVDPVCFNIFESQFIIKALYQKPSCFAHDFSLYLVFRDPLLASSLFRSFWWHQNNLFPEDIKVKTHVYLSKLDWILDAPTVFNYLERRQLINPNPNINLHILHMAHCEYIFNDDVLDSICQHV